MCLSESRIDCSLLRKSLKRSSNDHFGEDPLSRDMYEIFVGNPFEDIFNDNQCMRQSLHNPQMILLTTAYHGTIPHFAFCR